MGADSQLLSFMASPLNNANILPLCSPCYDAKTTSEGAVGTGGGLNTYMHTHTAAAALCVGTARMRSAASERADARRGSAYQECH